MKQFQKFSLKIRNDSLFYVFGSDSEDTLKIAVQLNAGEFSEFFDTKSDRNTSFSNYYFNNNHDGYYGRMLCNEWSPDGYWLTESGKWNWKEKYVK